jgi:hypothetical protein
MKHQQRRNLGLGVFIVNKSMPMSWKNIYQDFHQEAQYCKGTGVFLSNLTVQYILYFVNIITHISVLTVFQCFVFSGGLFVKDVCTPDT